MDNGKLAKVERLLRTTRSKTVILFEEICVSDDPLKFKRRRQKLQRRFINGNPLVAPQEIYANPGNYLSEQEVMESLNQLVNQGKAQIEMSGGELWYRLK